MALIDLMVYRAAKFTAYHLMLQLSHDLLLQGIAASIADSSNPQSVTMFAEVEAWNAFQSKTNWNLLVGCKQDTFSASLAADH